MKRTEMGRAAKAVALLSTACGLLTGCGAAEATSASPAATFQASAAVPLPDAPTAACTIAQLAAPGAQRVEPSNPDGTYSVLIPITNDGSKPCTLWGFPTVALAGQGSPDRNLPVNVSTEGEAQPVQLAHGGRAWVRLSFVPVLGEGDGYCASGADPFVAPSIVLGIGGGGIQLAMDDGSNFAVCDNKVRTTAFLATAP